MKTTTAHAESPPVTQLAPRGTTLGDGALESAVRYDQAWMTSALRPFLIATLVTCLNIALLTFLGHVAPSLPITYRGALITISTAAALIGCVSTTWLAQPRQRMKRNSGYRTAEIALLFGLTRLAVWVTVGNWPTLTQLLSFPLDTLLDGYFVTSVIIVGLSWTMATGLTSDMLRMALQPDEIEAARLRASREITDATPPNYTDRRAVLGGFVSRWLLGGILLVILSAAVRVGPATSGFFSISRQNIDPAVITAVVIYFLVGLILISQGQLAVLRARWTLEKVPSTANVLRNWPFYTFLLILGVGFLASLLPFGGTFYFAQILYTIIWFIYNSLMTIFQFFLGLLLLLISLLTGEETEQPSFERPSMELPQFEPAPEAAASMPPWLGGTLFWMFTALLLGYAAYIYFSGRGFRMAWLMQLWQTLRARWAELFGTYQDWQLNRMRRRVLSENNDDGSLPDGIWSWLRLRNLSPDQQVRYFYLSTLHRAERIGVPRRVAETPSQYAPRLMYEVAQLRVRQLEDAANENEVKTGEEKHPGATAEADQGRKENGISEPAPDLSELENLHTMEELTDAFLNVRYAGHHAPPEQLSYLKQLWERIKKRLRKR